MDYNLLIKISLCIIPLFCLFFFMNFMAYLATIEEIKKEQDNVEHKLLIISKKISSKISNLKNKFINFALLKH